MAVMFMIVVSMAVVMVVVVMSGVLIVAVMAVVGSCCYRYLF